MAAGGAGVVSPWYHKPATPAGYTTDPNTGRYIPIVGSGQDLLTQRTRQQQFEDEARATTFRRVEADRAARDALRAKLMGMLDRPLETATSAGYGGYGAGGGGGGVAGVAPEIGTIELPDTSAAQANIFARAKDKVGL